jgi:tetratricopeptide (TPR) repeat protein
MKSKLQRVCIGLCAVVALVSCGIWAQPVEELMSQGNQLLQNGAYDQAVTQFRKLLGRDPGNFEAQFNLAFAYLNMGRHSNAVQEFAKAIAINRQCGECYGNMALAYEAQGEDERALGALYEAVKVNPGNIESRMNLATVYANKGKVNDAIAQYKQVIAIDGQYITAHINAAKCLVSVGKPDEARGYLKSALAINNDEPAAHYELATILWKKDGKKDEALKMFQKAVALQPNTQLYYENYGLLLEDMDRKQDAIDIWKKYLVYLDDALKKESIQDRIEMLERGEAPSGVEKTDKLFGSQDRSGSISQLRSEVRGTEQSGGNTRIIDAKKPSVESDLEGLDKESDSDMDFDMKKAVRKKMSEKK